MSAIIVGSMAPDFTLEDNQGGTFNLKDFRGKKVLLSWHPLAWTSVCTDQMRALEANWDRFEKLNTVPVGLSVDPVPGKAAWAAVLSIRNVKLPSDFWPHGKAASELGIFNEELGLSERANILIDEDGKVAWVKVYPMSQLPDIEEVFAAIEAQLVIEEVFAAIESKPDVEEAFVAIEGQLAIFYTVARMQKVASMHK